MKTLFVMSAAAAWTYCAIASAIHFAGIVNGHVSTINMMLR